jgi:head-tail adaptor
MALVTTGDYVLWDGTEGVTLTADTHASGVTNLSVATALRRPLPGTREGSPTAGAYQMSDVIWEIPVALAGGAFITPGDRIVDLSAETWTVIEVAKVCLGSHWRCVCRNLRIAGNLTETIVIEVPTVTQTATGAQVKTWATLATVAGRLQPVEQEEFTGRGKKGPQARYEVFIATQQDPRSNVGDWGRVRIDSGGTKYYQITGYRQAERITDLPVIECVLLPGG